MDRRLAGDEDGLAPDRDMTAALERLTPGSLMASAGEGSPQPRLDAYRPGVCNIGPDEIVRRRRAGHVGLIVTVVVLAVLFALHVPPIVRLVIFVPAAGAAVGYLQAWHRFCAGFGAPGVYTFGSLGRTEHVDGPGAVARDRGMARRIAVESAMVGAVVAVLAVLVPN